MNSLLLRLAILLGPGVEHNFHAVEHPNGTNYHLAVRYDQIPFRRIGVESNVVRSGWSVWLNYRDPDYYFYGTINNLGLACRYGRME